MWSVSSGRRTCLALALAAPVCAPWAASAQPVAVDATAPLDPASPMAALPDLGVDWPDLGKAEPGELPVAGPATATATATATDAAAERRYRIVLAGVPETAGELVRTRFDQLSTLRKGEGSAANVAQIDRRARDDESVLRDLLRARGYYDADVRARVATDATDDRIVVTLDASPGTLYRFSAVATPGLAAAGVKADTLGASFPVKPGDPVDADKVLAAETALRAAVGREGFAFGTVGEPEVTIDHETHTAALTIPVAPGAPQRFGQVRVAGKELFSATHLSHIARFDPGDPYDAALVEDYRRALIQTGLVSLVKLTPVPAPGDRVDIATRLEPAPPRTVAGEVGYGTGEGARAQLSWTHRNFFPPEGALTVGGVGGTQEQSFGVSLRRSNFGARDRVLTALVQAAHTNFDAYDAKTATFSVGIERQSNIIWQKKWTWSASTEFVASDEKGPLTPRRTFLVAALPGTLAYDSTDDLLNPTRGFRLAGRLSPELSLRGSVFPYARAQVDASVYLPISSRIVLAGRTRFGTIVGAERDAIAPSRRFYAGGGGSVRGYGYQDIGPKDADDNPVGGRSVTEFAAEARIRFGNIGVVPFLDAGNIYTSAVPQLSGLRFGTGLGVRYYTSFGPIRVDLGTPIARRAGEPRVAVYVSLGQAF